MMMNNEEIERTMRFILEHQAQSTVKVDRLAEKVDALAENTNRLANAQLKYEARTGRLEESFLILVQLARSTDERLDNADRTMSEFSDKMGKVSYNLSEVSGKMNALTDAQLKYEARAGRLEESFVMLVQLAQSTDEPLDNVDRKMSEVSDNLSEVSDNLSEVSGKMHVLTDAQIRTDENIRNLSAVVDRYFSEGRNGNP
jgi:chromosome segregation ATPase